MNIIAAAGINGELGYQNRLIWNIPEDMNFFKEKTAGKTVVMGRKTFESLRIKPLPGRRNIVFTRDRSFSCDGVETVHSVSELMEYETDDIFVIGGAEIYRLLSDYCDTAYITRIFSEAKADSFIRNFDLSECWEKVYESELKEYDGVQYRFVTYKKA